MAAQKHSVCIFPRLGLLHRARRAVQRAAPGAFVEHYGIELAVGRANHKLMACKPRGQSGITGTPTAATVCRAFNGRVIGRVVMMTIEQFSARAPGHSVAIGGIPIRQHIAP